MSSQTAVIPGDDLHYVLCWILTVAMQLLFFAVAYTCSFDLVTDFAGSSNFILIALLTFMLSDAHSTRAVALTGLVVVSRLYLAFFLLYRVCTRKSDARFDDTRGDFCKFLAFWIFQMLWAFLVSLPVIYVNARVGATDVPVGPLDFIAWILGFGGLLIEVVADWQKFQFRNDPANRGLFCTVGLWQFSRHPNYFGEILIWVGAFIGAVPVIGGDAGEVAAGVLTVISPVFTIAILVFLSGLPTAEGGNLKRFYEHGQGEKWEAYVKRTPPIVLLPNAVYSRLPYSIKEYCCCELAMLRYPGSDVSRNSMEPAKSLQPGLDEVSSYASTTPAAAKSFV